MHATAKVIVQTTDEITQELYQVSIRTERKANQNQQYTPLVKSIASNPWSPQMDCSFNHYRNGHRSFLETLPCYLFRRITPYVETLPCYLFRRITTKFTQRRGNTLSRTRWQWKATKQSQTGNSSPPIMHVASLLTHIPHAVNRPPTHWLDRSAIIGDMTNQQVGPIDRSEKEWNSENRRRKLYYRRNQNSTETTTMDKL